MAADVFIDTSVLIYLYSNDEPEKQRRAEATIVPGTSWISAQCLSELAVQLRSRFGVDYPTIERVIEEQRSAFHIAPVNASTVHDALRLARRYHYSYFDSLTIAAALEQNCSVVYSERLHSGQRIDKRLAIHNPFVGVTKVSA